MGDKNSRVLAREWPYKRCSEFKADLQAAAAAWFSKQGYATSPRMPYCLASWSDWKHNIICADVAEYVAGRRGEAQQNGKMFPLHKYAHHGLSSQALTFNLIGPLLVRNDLAPLKDAFVESGLAWPEGITADNAVFEFEDRDVFNEDSGQPTSIDVALLGEVGKVFLEVKLSESEFGGCSVFKSGDCEGRTPAPDRLGDCYLHHIDRQYWVQAHACRLAEMPLFKGAICPFASYYQFFRELLFAISKEGTFVLLHDARNPAFVRDGGNGEAQRGLWPLLVESLPEGLSHRVGRVTIQALVQKIEDSGRHGDWIGKFKEKYAL